MACKNPINRKVITRASSIGLDPIFEYSIFAIKRGLVVKIPNIDACGRPTLKIKDVPSVYEYEDAISSYSSKAGQTFSCQTDGIGCSLYDGKVKYEPSSPDEYDYISKPNDCMAVDNIGNTPFNNNAYLEFDDDFELNGMTLNELRMRFKKQKICKSFVSGETGTKNHMYTPQHRKSYPASIEAINVESDLEVPLIILKEKLSRKSKTEGRRRKRPNLYSSDSSVRQGINETKQFLCTTTVQPIVPVDYSKIGEVVSVDNEGALHLESIKKEFDSEIVMTARPCFDSSFMSEHNFPECSISQGFEEMKGTESCCRESASSSVVLNYSTDGAFCSESSMSNSQTTENAIETCHHALSPMQEPVLCGVNSQQFSYNYSCKQETSSPGHHFTDESNADCHLPSKLLDEGLGWNEECDKDNVKSLEENSYCFPVDEVSNVSLSFLSGTTPCFSIDEASIELPILNHQASVEERTQQDIVIKGPSSSFLPMSKSSTTASKATGHERSDNYKSTIRVEGSTLGAFDSSEQNERVISCAGKAFSKEDTLNEANVFNIELKDDNIYTCRLPLEDTATVSINIDHAKIDGSAVTSSIESKNLVSMNVKQLSGEVSEISGNFHSIQPRERFKSEMDPSRPARNSSLFSDGASCCVLDESSLDGSEQKLIAMLEDKLCYLVVKEESSCSDGFLHACDFKRLGAVEKRDFLSHSHDQMSSVSESLHTKKSVKNIDDLPTNLMKMLSNDHSDQSDVISPCINIDGHANKEIKCLADHPPIKLLSNRKALSLTSQEKLCQAVIAASNKCFERKQKSMFEERTSSSPPESDPNGSAVMSSPEVTKFVAHGRRLSFEKRIECCSPDFSQKSNEVGLCPERTSKKPKNGSTHIITKSILKSPISGLKPCSCSESSLMRKQRQEAITFSQQQMHDIESLAMKLLRGLTSMKSIVEAASNSDDCLSELSKYTIEQMRIAIDSASELEETTKRWLHMMGRDCNRFCKILSSTLNKTAAPVGGLPKERKRIVFADEAGGTLCHVKVFEGHTSSLFNAENEGVELFRQGFLP